ncbi:MAG TPA: hypothetical protein VFG83_03410 [Kofleriaceae bacterium]|nr:hypothetical protein [Kofleriaceae bacterium]
MRPSPIVLAAAALAAGLTLAVPAQAAPCGIDYLPLSQGSEWTYGLVPNPENPKPGEVRVVLPSSLVIRVVKVEEAGDSTTITLEEKLGDHAVETTLACTKDGLTISPQSFFFAGEPGGGLNMTLSDVKRVGVTYPGAKGFRSGASWVEKLTAHVVRAPAEGSGAKLAEGKVQIERRVSIGGRDRAETPLQNFRATSVRLTLTGRAMVEPNLKVGVEMPDGPAVRLWFASGVGLVMATNRFGDTWQLTAVSKAE